MLKTKLCQIVLLGCFLGCSTVLLSQEEETLDPTLQKPIQLIAQIGLGGQISNLGGGFVSFSVERPIKLYQHLGLQFNVLTPRYSIYTSGYDRPVQKGSFDIGVFSKFFLHGRLTGRKSSIYFGPEVCYGIRKVAINTQNAFETVPTVRFKEKNTKVLLRWGVQYKFGVAVLEINLPIGFESVKSPYDNDAFVYLESTTSYRFSRFVIIPGLHLGISL